MQLSLEQRFFLPSDKAGFKGVTYNDTMYLNNDDEDKYIEFKITDQPLQSQKNKLIVNKELWLLFTPKYPTQNNIKIIAFKLIFLSNNYPIELYLILTVNFNKKLLMHITNSSEYCYIRSNNKFLISRTNRSVGGDEIGNVYSHINVIYTNVNNNINNSEFYPVIINPQKSMKPAMTGHSQNEI